MNVTMPDYALWETFREQIKTDTFPMLGELEGEEPFKASQILLEKYFSKIDDTSDFEDIYHIVTLLNSFYSTRMVTTRCYEIAQYIKGEENFHKNILNKSTLEEDIIAKKEKTIKSDADVIDAFFSIVDDNPKTDKIQFSFMTKYCSLYSFYNTESKESLYPICDFLILTALQEEQSNTLQDSNKDLVNVLELYDVPKTIASIFEKSSFFEIMKAIRIELGVEYRKLDTFLWRRGKHIALVQNTKALKTQERVEREKAERSNRNDRFDRSDRPSRSFDRGDRSNRSDRNDRYDRSDRPSRSFDRGDRPERSDRNDRYDRSDRPSRSFDRGDRPERSDRNDRYDRSDRPSRSFDRSDRPERSDRPSRSDRNDRDDRRDGSGQEGKSWT